MRLLITFILSFVFSVFLTLMVGSQEAYGAIAFDSVNSNTTTTSTLVFSLTVASNSNRMLVVGAAAESAAASVAVDTCRATSVTYNGVSLTRAGEVNLDDTGADLCGSLWYLQNPAAGTFNVQITVAGTVTELDGGAISLYDVNQSVPEATNTSSATGNPTSITTYITTLTNDAWVVDSAGSGNLGAFTADTGQTQRYDRGGTTAENTVSTKPVAAAGLTSMKQSQAANRMVHILASFAPGPDITAPTITVQSPTNTTIQASSVWANVTLNEAGSAVLRSLDGGANVSLTNSSGNWNNNITGLSDGPHSVKIYANDTSGNQASPQTVFFTVDTTDPSNKVCFNGTGTCFNTVQQAINAASAGQVIVITNSSNYNQSVVINVTGIHLTTNMTSTPPTILASLNNTPAINISASNATVSKIIVHQNVSGSTAPAIEASNVGNITLDNNTIKTTAGSSSAIFGRVFGNSTISNNIIRTNGTSSNNIGINLTTGSDKNNVTDNNIATNGTLRNYGIYLSGSNSTDVLNNVITANGSTDNPTTYGVFLSSSHLNNVTKNNITTDGNSIFNILGHGVVLSGSDSNNVGNNIINTNGNSDSSHGINIQNNARFNNITDNVISTGGTNSNSGIITSANSNNFVRNNITSRSGSNDYGMSFSGSANNNNVTGGNITMTGASDQGVLFTSNADNNRITDSIINATKTFDILDQKTSQGNNYIINSTFNKTDISFSTDSIGKVFIQYYLDVRVVDTSNNPISGATVIGNDTNSVANIENPTSNFTGTTNSTGYINQQVLSEFLANLTYNSSTGGTGYLYFTNYTLNTSASGYEANNSFQINLTDSRTVTIVLSTVANAAPRFGYTANTTYQGTTQITPADRPSITYSSSNNVSLDYNITDPDNDNGIDTVVFQINGTNFTNKGNAINPGSFSPTVRVYNKTLGGRFYLNLTSVRVGTYVGLVWVNDSSNAQNQSTNFTITINRLAPTQTFTPATSTITYNTTVNEACSSDSTDSTQISNLYRDSVLISSPRSNFVNGVGSITYSCDSLQTANYSQVSGNSTLTVNAGTPNTGVFVNNRNTNATVFTYKTTLTLNGNSTTNDFSTPTFLLSVNNTQTSAFPTASGTNATLNLLLGNGTYFLTYNTSGNANWTSATSSLVFIIQKGSPTITLTPATSTITFPDTVNEACSSTNDDSTAVANFYRGTTLYTPVTGFGYAAGTQVVSCDSLQTANYSQANSNNTVTINKGILANYTDIRFDTNAYNTTLTVTYNATTNVNGRFNSTGADDITFRLFLGNVIITGNNNTAIVYGGGTNNFRYGTVTTTATNWTTGNTSTLALTVNQGTPDARTFIDSLAKNKTVNSTTSVTIRGNSTTSFLGPTFNLYVNTSSASGNPATITTSFAIGTHNVVYNTSGNANWTSASNSSVYLIVRTAITVQQPTNTTFATTSVWANVTLDAAGSVVFRSLDGGANVSLTNSSGNWNNQMTGLSDGPHRVTFYANDTAGKDAESTVTVFFTVDSTAPTITIQQPTNTTFTTSTVWANVTLNEAGSWCGRSLDGGANTTMTNSSGNWNNQMTSLSQTPHSVRVYCNDTTGNMAASSTVFFTVDTIPTITADSPTNTTYTVSSIWANATISEVASVVLRSLDGGANVSLTNSSGNWNNQMTSLSQGPHGVTIYANDTNGNDASPVTVFFTVDLPATAAGCYNQTNISSFYICSYDNSEFPVFKSAAIIYSGKADRFSSLCNDVVGDSYKFNLTAIGQLQTVIPFTNGVCANIGNKTGVIERQGAPSTPFNSSFELRGPTNLQLRLQYEKIRIAGDGRFPEGNYRICAKKIGQEGSTVIVNVTAC